MRLCTTTTGPIALRIYRGLVFKGVVTPSISPARYASIVEIIACVLVVVVSLSRWAALREWMAAPRTVCRYARCLLAASDIASPSRIRLVSVRYVSLPTLFPYPRITRFALLPLVALTTHRSHGWARRLFVAPTCRCPAQARHVVSMFY